MIPRYEVFETSQIWSEENRIKTWVQIEATHLQFLSTQAPHIVDSEECLAAAARLRKLEWKTILERSNHLEKSVRHDVQAFVTTCERMVGGPRARWIHYGLTSSDIVDTALALHLRRSSDLILDELADVEHQLVLRASLLMDTAVVGRSHGQAAEAVSLGHRFLSHSEEFKRCIGRVTAAREEISYGKLSGSMGNCRYFPPQVEIHALHFLGLKPEPFPTQVIPRDRHLVFFQALASVGAAVERLATEVRLMSQSGIGEASEGFGKAQVGSSSMPHKRNPIGSENLCGMARMLRGYASMAAENANLWYERDISHSSVERMICPDATGIAVYALRRMSNIVLGLVFNEPRIAQNLRIEGDELSSQKYMLAMIRRGLGRADAHHLVQSATELRRKDNYNSSLAFWVQEVFRRDQGEGIELETTLPPLRIDGADKELRHSVNDRPIGVMQEQAKGLK